MPSQRHMHRKSFAIKDHRAADCLTRDEWLQWKAHFHISDPRTAPKFGTKQWDELHKIRPFLEKFLMRCLKNVKGGRKASIDEITIGFQGHSARLKQRCGKFKRAGDGFQVGRCPCMLVLFYSISQRVVRIRLPTVVLYTLSP